MNYTDRKTHACYANDYLSLSFDNATAHLAFLGLDAGGRDASRKNTYNLLKPGHGAWSPIFKAAGKPAVKASPTGVSAKAGAVAQRFRFTGAKTFVWSLDAGAAPLKGTAFELRLAIRTAPPTIWADTDPPDPSKPAARPRDPLVYARRRWSLPMTVHFPDYGLVRIETAGGPLDCEETLVKSADMAGLNLGFQNLGGHRQGCALHHGWSRLVFRLAQPAARAALRFTVLEEQYPRHHGDAFDGAAGSGLRRCWMNNFTLERNSCTMGDNIYLGGLAHLSMHHKADLLDLMDPADPLTQRIRATFVRTLDDTWRLAQAADGEINWEYAGRSKGERQMGSFIDTTPSALISSAMIGRWEPAHVARWIDAMIRAGDFLMRLDVDGDGIIEIPFSGNSFNAPYSFPRPRNWWDNFAFGHKDAFFNLTAHRALRQLLPFARELGRRDAAERIAAFLDRFDANFRRVFRNPESGVIAGWISADGAVHDYRFTFTTALAVTEGVVGRREGAAMLRRLLRQMKRSGFGDFRFGIPGPTIPVARPDTIDWAFMGDWPMYENGGCCGLTAYHFLNALYHAGLVAEADAILFKMLETFETKATHSGLFPGYMESVDWRTKDGVPCGYNYLADNYVFLGAAVIAKGGLPHPAIAPARDA